MKILFTENRLVFMGLSVGPKIQSRKETLPKKEIKRYDRKFNKEVKRNLRASSREFKQRMQEAIARTTTKFVNQSPGAQQLKSFAPKKFEKVKHILARKLSGKFRINDLKSLRMNSALNIGILVRSRAKISNRNTSENLSATFVSANASKKEQLRAILEPSLNIASKLSEQGISANELRRLASQSGLIARNARTKAVMDIDSENIITQSEKYMVEALNEASA